MKKDMEGHNPALSQITRIEGITNKCARKVVALNIKSRNESDYQLNKTLNESSKTKLDTVELLKEVSQ